MHVCAALRHDDVPAQEGERVTFSDFYVQRASLRVRKGCSLFKLGRLLVDNIRGLFDLVNVFHMFHTYLQALSVLLGNIHELPIWF